MALSDGALKLLDLNINPLKPDVIAGKIDMTDALASIDGMTDAFKPLGCSICALVWLIHFVQNTLQENELNEKKMFFDLIFACFCALLIQNYQAIIDLAQNIGTTALNLITETGSDGIEITLKDLLEVADDEGLIAVAGKCMMYFTFGTIAGWICTGIAFLALYTRQIEICLRTVFMPVALGFLTDEGWRGPAVRYIKKYIACYLQGPIILCCVYLYSILVSPEVNGSLDFVSYFALAFACAGLIQKSSQIANDIMGV